MTIRVQRGCVFETALGISSFSLRESGIRDDRGGVAQNSRFSETAFLKRLWRFLLLFSLFTRIGNSWIGGLEVRNM